MVFYGGYAVISSIFQFTRGLDGIADGLITLMLGGVFCAIIGYSFFGKTAAFLRRMERMETAKKQTEKIKIKPKTKDVIASVAVLIIGLGAAAVCWYFSAQGFKNVNEPDFIKTEAVLRRIDDGLFYEFSDLNGNTVLAPSTIGVSGITLMDGYSTTVYYNALNPEVIRQTPIYIILCAGGIFAAAVGVLVCMHQLNMNLNYLLPFPSAIVFIGVPVGLETAFAVFTGYPFFILLVGGAGIYACNGMIVLGIYFLYVGVKNVIKKAKGFAV